MPDRVGQQMGNYRLVKLLGKGGFAEVYLGQHVRLASKQAAIKILHLFDVDARKFQEEAETTEKLVHPHIVRLLDFDLQEGTPFLVLDFAPGGSLRTRHPKGSVVPLATVGEYLKELAPALQYAHDKHILHRDIKPDNMLIGRRGELLLSDFGIAVLSQTGRTSLEASYGIGGTPYYMAPEAYRGKPEKASDQYALAVVAYEWLCGSVPFSEGNFIQLGYQHTHEPVPPLRDKNPAIPSEVEAVVMKALAKDPAQRFQTILEFAEALEKAAEQFSLELLLTFPIPKGEDVRDAEWVWGNHYLFIFYGGRMQIIDVLTGKTVFSEMFKHYFVAVFWERENCTVSFPEGIISLTDLLLIDTRTGKHIASIADDDVTLDALNEKYEGFEVFSQSPEGRKIITLANSLIKSDTGWQDWDALRFLMPKFSSLLNSVSRNGPSRISFCPPQWQFVAVARVDEAFP